MQLKLLQEGDWAGIFTMAVDCRPLQTVLEEAQGRLVLVTLHLRLGESSRW